MMQQPGGMPMMQPQGQMQPQQQRARAPAACFNGGAAKPASASPATKTPDAFAGLGWS
jgi:hypothetical protein